MRAAGAFAVYCLHLNPAARSAFRMLGFAQRGSGWPLMLRAGEELVQHLPLLRDPRNWFLTAGDSNVDRPRDGIIYAEEPAPSSVR
jgi:hypothetical protein